MVRSATLVCLLAAPVLLFAGPARALPTTPWEIFAPPGVVTYAGDVDGDGFDDILLGLWYYDGGETDEGAVRLYRGSAAGPISGPAWSYESNVPHAELGDSVAGAGDVNGDGYDDVIVGAPTSSVAMVFHGSPTGLSLSPVWTASGAGPVSKFGFSVAGAGDVNGDGYDDVIVGDPYDGGGLRPFRGSVSLFLGSPTGLQSASATVFKGDTGGIELGHSVAGAGDVNGDGYDDVIAGAWKDTTGALTSHGSMTLLYGGPAGMSFSGWKARSYQSFSMFGSVVRGAGDVNGDGYADIMAGAPLWGSWSEGGAVLYHGGPSGPSSAPDWSLTTAERGVEIGSHLTTAGDMDGDGFDDIALSSRDYRSTPAGDGAFGVLLGGVGGVGGPPALGALGSTLGTVIDDVVGGGDVDGDGFDDLIVADWIRLRVYPGGP